MSLLGRAKILVVEDESDVRELICLHLKREGFAVDEAADGEQGIRMADSNTYDLLILDWMLPGMSGLELAKGIRQKSPVPILMVTARAEGADIVLGLESGADDYVIKPFEIPVFLARVRALLRRKSRSQAAQESETLAAGDLKVDLAAHEAWCSGQQLSLTPSEFNLLVALIQNRGRVLTRDKLIDLVRGTDVSIVARAIDTHVFGLRKKLGPCADLIETIRGVGYRVKAPDA